MRLGTFDTDFVTVGDVIVGVNLGYDFVSEHEWGIEPIENKFGLNKDTLGYESRKNTRTDVPCFELFELSDSVALVFDIGDYLAKEKNEQEAYINRRLPLFSKNGCISGAWDQSSFGVRVSKAHSQILRDLYSAFQNGNLVITLNGKRQGLSNPGLCLLDYSKIPAEIKKQASEQHQKSKDDAALFRKLEAESGVFEALQKSGKKFMFLRMEKMGPEGKPLWWLNPEEQHKYRAGWYHTEDLLAWARNEGPVELW